MSRNYTKEYKMESVKLAKEIGTSKAAEELQIPKDTLYGWVKAEKRGEIDIGRGSRSPGETLTLVEELQEYRRKNKELEKENSRLKKENEFLEEASCFFAALRKK
jgi:transposase